MKIEKRVRILSALLAIVLAAMLTPPLRAADIPAGATIAYVGTYTNNPQSKGIYALALQGSNEAALAPLGVAAQVTSPSFLAVDPRHRFVFAVNEVDQSNGQPGGGVSSFSIDPRSGMLTAINQQSSMGKGPCHVLVDSTGKNVLVANYGSGSVAVYQVAADGRLSEATCFIQHQGSSVNKSRQEGPHAHCVALDAANRFAFVCDLGLDKVMIYRFDAQNGKITPNDPPFATVKPGSGPRHITFGRDGKFAYVNSEMASTVTVFSYDDKSGALSEVQSLSTLPPDFTGNTSTAEIAVHPSGKFLYVSNRGHDSIATFNIDQAKGTLTWVEAHPSGGKTPRHFAIDPSGKYLVMENQGTGTIVLSAIDPNSGRLTDVGKPVQVASPVCVIFVSAPQ
jgi:6-phosphogluconolactonase